MQPKAPLPGVSDPALKAGNAENVKRISAQILAAADIDQILLDLRHDILSCFDAEDLTLFVVDSEKKEIFPRSPISIRFRKCAPRSQNRVFRGSAPSTSARSMWEMPSLAELGTIHPALTHDATYDKNTGFKTKQVLTYPVVAENKYLMGVIQLLNKKSGGRFTRKDEECVAEIAKALGTAFHTLRKLPKATVEIRLSTEQRQNLTTGSRCRLDRSEEGHDGHRIASLRNTKFRRPNWASHWPTSTSAPTSSTTNAPSSTSSC